MSVSVDSLNQFFKPLVGTPEHVSALQDGLAASLAVPLIIGGRKVTDPYAKLDNSLQEKISTTADSLTYEQLEENGDNPVEALVEISEGVVFGGRLAIAALRTAGNIYTSLAEAPQRQTTVARNTKCVVHTVYSTAFTNTEDSRVTLGALKYGVNPHNWLNARILRFITSDAQEISVSPSFFKTTTNKNDQLTISPRFALQKGRGGSPAGRSGAVGEKPRRPALLTFMYAIGAVANEHIYPNQFAVVEQ